MCFPSFFGPDTNSFPSSFSLMAIYGGTRQEWQPYMFMSELFLRFYYPSYYPLTMYGVNALSPTLPSCPCGRRPKPGRTEAGSKTFRTKIRYIWRSKKFLWRHNCFLLSLTRLPRWRMSASAPTSPAKTRRKSIFFKKRKLQFTALTLLSLKASNISTMSAAIPM